MALCSNLRHKSPRLRSATLSLLALSLAASPSPLALLPSFVASIQDPDGRVRTAALQCLRAHAEGFDEDNVRIIIPELIGAFADDLSSVRFEALALLAYPSL